MPRPKVRPDARSQSFGAPALAPVRQLYTHLCTRAWFVFRPCGRIGSRDPHALALGRTDDQEHTMQQDVVSFARLARVQVGGFLASDCRHHAT